MAEHFDSVVIYESWLKVAKNRLPEEKVNKLMVQLIEYGLYGTVPNNDDLAMDVIFEMAKPNIDSNIKKKISGRKGGRKVKEKSAKTYGLSNGNANANANGNGNANVNANVLHPVGSPSLEGSGSTTSAAEEEKPDWAKDDVNE